MCLGKIETNPVKIVKHKTSKKYKAFYGTPDTPEPIVQTGYFYPSPNKNGYIEDEIGYGFHYHTDLESTKVWRRDFIAKIKVKQINDIDKDGDSRALQFKIVKIIESR